MLTADQFLSLRAFVESARAGSFTAAAERLGGTRSGVGKAVARLERRLGTRLLQRGARGLVLTEEGRDYLADCEQALAAFESAEARIAARRGQPHGRVRLTLPQLFGRQWVLPVLQRLGQQRPALDFDLHFSSARVDLQAEGVDLALRIGVLDDHSTLVARALGQQRTLLCAAPDYLARAGHLAQPEVLAAHECLCEPEGATTSWTLADTQGRVMTSAVQGRWRLDDLMACRDAAVAGLGIALLPQWLALAPLRSGQLQRVLPDWEGPSLPIHLLWPHPGGGTALPLRVRVVVDALCAAFGPMPPWEAEALASDAVLPGA